MSDEWDVRLAQELPERIAADIVNACRAMRHEAIEAQRLVASGNYMLGLAALDVLRRNAFRTRNALGQWVDSMVCPHCGKEGKSLSAVRQGRHPDHPDLDVGIVDIGFTCEHCRREWGFEVLKDAEAT